VKVKIITNHVPRLLLSWDELTRKEKDEFEFTGRWSCDYFRYKHNIYCLADFMSIREIGQEEFAKWHGYAADTFFSGTVIKVCYQEGTVTVGRVFECTK